jgi:hypothetical protein
MSSDFLTQADERIAHLLALPQAGHVMRFKTLDDECGTVLAVLAVEGREGVFCGYGVTKPHAAVSAWENMRDLVSRSGKGYLLP